MYQFNCWFLPICLFSFLVGKRVSRVSNFRVCICRQIPKTGDKERRAGSLHIPGHVVRRPNMVTDGEGNEDTPHLSAEDGTENTACCMQRQGEG